MATECSCEIHCSPPIASESSCKRACVGTAQQDIVAAAAASAAARDSRPNRQYGVSYKTGDFAVICARNTCLLQFSLAAQAWRLRVRASILQPCGFQVSSRLSLRWWSSLLLLLVRTRGSKIPRPSAFKTGCVLMQNAFSVQPLLCSSEALTSAHERVNE